MLLVAVQQRQRLIRDGLCQLLAVEEDVTVAGSAATADDLLRVCKSEQPDVALLEADANGWDVTRLTVAVRRLLPDIRVIGLLGGASTPLHAAMARRAGMRALVGRAGGISEILGALRATGPNGQLGSCVGLRATGWPEARTVLTPREITVLSLVGAGHTSREISGQLQISYKTVENHKQRIFAKLGVQNQAHAVSVAMREGLMHPEQVIGLALAE